METFWRFCGTCRRTSPISPSCRVKLLFLSVLSLSYSLFLLLFGFHWLGKKTFFSFANWFLWPLPIRLILLQTVSQCRSWSLFKRLARSVFPVSVAANNRQLQGEIFILKIWSQGCAAAMTSVECQSNRLFRRPEKHSVGSRLVVVVGAPLLFARVFLWWSCVVV